MTVESYYITRIILLYLSYLSGIHVKYCTLLCRAGKRKKKKRLSRRKHSSFFPPPIVTPLDAHIPTKSAMKPLLRLAHQKGASNLLLQSRRSLTTRSTALHQPRALIRPSISYYPNSSLQQPFRRSYADSKPQTYFRRSRTTLRWIWRLVYLGAIGGIGYLGYTIYLLRTPPEQLEADPAKKTLVVLGLYSSIAS